MTYIKPAFRHPSAQPNAIGYYKKDYEGALSTLCAGCGHDSINGAIVQACFELAIEPHRIAKLSGIGCSSKSPTYFMSKSHGFNTVHGRMPSVATGAQLANKDLIYLGVSGDGDTVSIGMGQFAHAIRRNLIMLYILMNNGCYGLTKGQDSATADAGSISKGGNSNPFQAIDIASLGMELGATYVARSFSGDKAQLIPLIKAGLAHKGFALIDVISPCVTYNNNAGSTKSYDYTREHIEATGSIDLVPMKSEIVHDQPTGTTQSITLHDDDEIAVHKLHREWDPTDKQSASARMNRAKADGEILTGLIYVSNDYNDLVGMLNMSERPMNELTEKELCPGQKVLDEINAGFR